MFQALIDQAYDMIQRLYACAEKGRNEVPLAVTIRYSEYEAWETTAYGILKTVFGPDAAEISRWRSLADRRAMLLGEARRSDVKRGEFFGLIDYFNLAIGVLREYDAVYQHERSSAALAAHQAGEPPSDLAPIPAHERLQQPTAEEQIEESQDQFDEPEVVRRAAEDRWDVIVGLNNDVYNWLHEMAAAREPTKTADGAAVARLAAAIIERVAAQMQRSREHGAPEHPQAR
jgi:hypothetical protein